LAFGLLIEGFVKLFLPFMSVLIVLAPPLAGAAGVDYGICYKFLRKAELIEPLMGSKSSDAYLPIVYMNGVFQIPPNTKYAESKENGLV
jgi:hypothetical protein